MRVTPAISLGAALLASVELQQQPSAQEPPASISCSTSVSVLRSNEPGPVELVAFLGEGMRASEWTITWSIERGAITQQGSGRVEWSLGSKPPLGEATATATARHSSGKSVTCKTGLVVSTVRSAGQRMVIRRKFLARNEVPEPKLGLYSYLLAGTAPRTDSEKDRWKLLLGAVAGMNEFQELADSGLARERLSITYIPVALNRDPLDLEFKAQQPRSDDANFLEWMARNYDHGFASSLIATASNLTPSGVYLVSSRQPLSLSNRTAETLYVFQDFAGIDANKELIVRWVSEFERQATQARFTEGDWLLRVQLGMRNWISVGGAGLPKVLSAARVVALGTFKTSSR